MLQYSVKDIVMFDFDQPNEHYFNFHVFLLEESLFTKTSDFNLGSTL